MRLVLFAAAIAAALALIAPDGGVLSGREHEGSWLFELGRAGLPHMR